MLDISQDIHSLSEFKRKTSDFLARMKTTGRPQVLTINGKAELVVQDAESYQKLLNLVERVEAIEGIERGLDSMNRGKGRAADKVLARLRKKLKIARS